MVANGIVRLDPRDTQQVDGGRSCRCRAAEKPDEPKSCGNPDESKGDERRARRGRRCGKHRRDRPGGRHRDNRSNPRPAGILANIAATRAKPSVEPAIPPAGGIAWRQVVECVLEGGDDNRHRAEGTWAGEEVWGAIGAAALIELGQAAAAETDIKFTLDWKFQGPTAAFFVAEEQGYFDEEGLDVTIDAGNGSAGAVNRVASGAYEMGFADINALVEFNVSQPGPEPSRR